MVPGADRKLREHHHHLANEFMDHHQRHRHLHQHMAAVSARPQYDALCSKDHHRYEGECGPLLNKTPPDVCTTNKCVEFAVGGGDPMGIDIERPHHHTTEDVCMSLQPALAGQTIPITVKNSHNVSHHHSILPPPDGQASSTHSLYAASSKYGTMPHPGSGSSQPPPTTLEVNCPATYCAARSSTLQHSRGRKKCVTIETFHAPEASGFADFSGTTIAVRGAATAPPTMAINYSRSAV